MVTILIERLRVCMCTLYVLVSCVNELYMDMYVCSSLISPVYTRPLNQFGSQLSLSWLSVNVLNRFTSRLLNRFVNHVWEVV